MKTGGMSCRVGERDGPSPSVLVESICKVRNGKVRYTADSTSTDKVLLLESVFTLTVSICLAQRRQLRYVLAKCRQGAAFIHHHFICTHFCLVFLPGFSSSYGYGFVTFLLSAPLSSLSSPFLRAPFWVPSSTTIVGLEVEKKLLQRHPTTSGKITRWEQECLSSLRV